MLDRMKEQWRDLKSGRPGERFQSRYERRKGRRSGLWKPVYVTLGMLLCLIGIVMIPAPGPGLLVAFIGGAMLAEESLVVAKAFDWLEVKLRAARARLRRAWRASGPKALVAVAGALAIAAIGLTAYSLIVA